jgi:predicted glutamine amidotransferase
LQSDGWGIGYYTNSSVHLIKSEQPVYEERGKLASTIKNAESQIILVHIRKASNPRGLPRERLISVENSQPFVFGKYLFAHNGSVNIPDEVAEALGEWKANIKGFNDSEVYFWYLIKEMSKGKEFSEAMKNFEKTLWRLWEENQQNHPDMSQPYYWLNTLFTDGKKIYAYCKYDEAAHTALSLCFRDQPGFQMSYFADSSSLIITSEKTNLEDNWQPLKSGQLLIGEVDKGKIRIVLTKI